MAQYLSRLACAQVRTLHEKIPSPACGGIKNQDFSPWRPSLAQHLSRLAARPRTQCLSAWRAAQSRIVHGKIPSPACGGRWPQAGRGGIKNQDFSPWRPSLAQYLSRLAARPVFIPLGANPAFISLGHKYLPISQQEKIFLKTVDNPSSRLREEVSRSDGGGQKMSICPA